MIIIIIIIRTIIIVILIIRIIRMGFWSILYCNDNKEPLK